MHKVRINRQEQIGRLALDLLDACGGSLNKKDTARFFRNKEDEDGTELSISERNYIVQYAEQLITNP